MKKLTYITLVVFTLPLFLISCANEYDGGIYTGSSMSTNPSDENLSKKIQTTKPEVAPQDDMPKEEREPAISEENYK